MTRLLEQHISAVFDKVDVTLQSVALHFEDQVARGPLDATALEAYLAQHNLLVPEVIDLRIVDQHGLIRFGSGFDPAIQLSVAGREFFLRARDDPQAGLVIAGPVLGPISQQWVLVFARRLSAPDGSFVGLVFRNFATTDFAQFLSSVELGAQGAAFIRTADLALVHRFPSAPSANDRNDVAKQLRDIAQAGPQTSVFTTATALGGVERINIYRKLQRYPFFVIVGRAADNAHLGG